jgi:hypothetical protein
MRKLLARKLRYEKFSIVVEGDPLPFDGKCPMCGIALEGGVRHECSNSGTANVKSKARKRPPEAKEK